MTVSFTCEADAIKGKWKEDANGCHIWQGDQDGGYGRQRYRRKRWGAHVLSYIAAYGSVPPGAHVHHICENPLCVNPKHLRVVTLSEHNILHHTKLTPEDIAAIQKATGSQRQIARQFGISQGHVSRIKRGINMARRMSKEPIAKRKPTKKRNGATALDGVPGEERGKPYVDMMTVKGFTKRTGIQLDKALHDLGPTIRNIALDDSNMELLVAWGRIAERRVGMSLLIEDVIRSMPPAEAKQYRANICKAALGAWYIEEEV